MTQAAIRRSEKTGLPPGTLVHIGQRRTPFVKITVMDYDEDHFHEEQISSIQDCFAFKATETMTWINIDGLHDTDVIEKVGRHFGLHPLTMEDVLNTGARPKSENCDNYIFVILKMLTYDADQQKVNSEQVSLAFGRNFVISFQESIGDVFDQVRDRIRGGKARARKMGADYLAYRLIDAVVDHYFVILEKIGDKIEEMENVIEAEADGQLVRRVHLLKRELILLRKSVWPLREAINGLQKSDTPLIAETTDVYLRDVYDHTIQVIDTIETFRDIASGMVDLYLSNASNRMNAVMKVLTIIATIFIPLTFIAGLYGMNFQYMPELRWPWGYPFALFLMAAVAAGMLLFFRRKNWL